MDLFNNMATNLEALAQMEYPGRFIILGRSMNGEDSIAIYGITGRSLSSQARKLAYQETGRYVSVRPTDETVVHQGNRDLLIYPAIAFEHNLHGVIVSNGQQTDAISRKFLSLNAEPFSVLAHALESWSYEPDAPHFTPRISGFLDSVYGYLCIQKKEQDGLSRAYFSFPLVRGKGKLLATYTGKNVDPLPSFQGEPFDMILEEACAQELAADVYHSLEPRNKEDDFRVAVCAVYFSPVKRKQDVAIINRCDLEKAK